MPNNITQIILCDARSCCDMMATHCKHALPWLLIMKPLVCIRIQIAGHTYWHTYTYTLTLIPYVVLVQIIMSTTNDCKHGHHASNAHHNWVYQWALIVCMWLPEWAIPSTKLTIFALLRQSIESQNDRFVIRLRFLTCFGQGCLWETVCIVC